MSKLLALLGIIPTKIIPFLSDRNGRADSKPLPVSLLLDARVAVAGRSPLLPNITRVALPARRELFQVIEDT